MDAMRLGAVARKEWIQLRRDVRSMILAFVLPMFLLLFFGYAIRWDIRDIPLAVLDQDGSPQSRELVEAFEASGYFSVKERPGAAREVADLLARGTVRAALIIPPGFAVDLAAAAGSGGEAGGAAGTDRSAPVQLLLDGSDANTATISLGYADAIVARYSSRVLLQGREVVLPVRAEPRVWYNPTLESANMIVPALVAVIMSIIAAMLTALTISREWERGTMEQLASTPVHRLEVVLGKLIPYLGIGAVDVSIAVAAGILVFGVPFRGSVLLLGALTLLFLIGALGVGMFISATLKSQVLATQAAIVATYLPALLLSGFLFDIASMPVVLRGITYIVPARYYVAVTRGIFLKGVGADVLWVQGLFMALFAAVGLGLATRMFRKEIG
ncbi:MAG: ABC transporter permease [Gemmatimonadetes bacterium]|nr:ABC transporter permease [Gemmatimonadota bacterium]